MGNDHSNLTYLIPDPNASEINGETIVHINKSYPKTKDYIDEVEKSTVLGMIEDVFKNHGGRNALGYRKPKNATDLENHFTFFKYSQIQELSKNLIQNIKKHNLVDVTKFDDQPGDWKIF